MSKHKWFYNFDGLRFFAALLVVIAHIETIKEVLGFPSLYNYSFFTYTAPLAVTFFFVLSGFLIAYLLLHEQKKDKKQKINLSKFYRNRALRIWPLYYLVVLLTFVVFPHISVFRYHNFDKDFLQENLDAFIAYILFLPNYSDHQFGNILYIGQAWSLGVEEFFYLFFPLGVYLLPARKQLHYFILLITASVAITAVAKFWCSADDPNLPLTCIYISRYKVYAFALGALCAYIYSNNQHKIFLLASKRQLKIASMMLFCITVVLLFSEVNLGSLTHPFYSVMFAAMLFLFTISDIKIRLLNHPYVIYLGRISYGIYMLHPIAIVAALKLFYINTGNTVLNVLLFDSMTIALVIVFSIISYNWFEKIFLRMRK